MHICLTCIHNDEDEDADGDGVLLNQDCDDRDVQRGAQSGDQDCDGIDNGSDYDRDGDGLNATLDCNDRDPDDRRIRRANLDGSDSCEM